MQFGNVNHDGKVVGINVAGGGGASVMLEAVRVLDRAHLDPATLVLREPTLDDVFLELTGRATTDDDGSER